MARKDKGSKKTLEEVIETLSNIEDVKTAVIFTDDGEIIGPGDALFAQVSARRMAMEEGASADLGADPPNEITLASKSERVIVMRINSQTLLAVRAEPEANQQLISMEMSRAATAVKELMKRKKKA